VTEEADQPVARDQHGNPVADGGEAAREAGFRTWGKSKDHRDDLPQVVIGMAVTRDGIPLRVWCWPGNTADPALIRQVKDDLRDWTLSRVIWVADRGFTSAENRRYLRKGGSHYIIGERLRSGSAEAGAALSRQGRYQEVAGNLRVKEVRIAEDERFVICHNPEGAERDAAIRVRLIAQLKELIDGADALPKDKRAGLRGVISTRPGLNRYLRVTPGGLLRVDAAKAKAEENLDGKYLLRTSDPKMTAEDIALGYKQLLEVERGWRDMKQVIDLRPVYHRKEERIRAHVILCWLALLLARIAPIVQLAATASRAAIRGPSHSIGCADPRRRDHSQGFGDCEEEGDLQGPDRSARAARSGIAHIQVKRVPASGHQAGSQGTLFQLQHPYPWRLDHGRVTLISVEMREG
jgi:transposase